MSYLAVKDDINHVYMHKVTIYNYYTCTACVTSEPVGATIQHTGTITLQASLYGKAELRPITVYRSAHADSASKRPTILLFLVELRLAVSHSG